MSSSKKPISEPTSENKKARYSYTIVETVEAGLVLVGSEVKAIRAGNVSLREAYAKVRNGEVWLMNMYIPPYKLASHYNHEARRDRKLLLNQREVEHFDAELGKGGYALVPLKMYFKRGRVKILLGLGSGKKSWDKRRAIADRDAAIDLARYFRR